jgi:hypothetical protein
MSQHVFSLASGTFFLLIAIAHLLRIVFGIPVVVQDIPIPAWASGIAVVITGFLAYEGFHFAGKRKPEL